MTDWPPGVSSSSLGGMRSLPSSVSAEDEGAEEPANDMEGRSEAPSMLEPWSSVGALLLTWPVRADPVENCECISEWL